MLTIVIPESSEMYDEDKEEFVTLPEVTLELEHSLVSISKWESKWEVPFLGHDEKNQEQTLDYIRCMVVGDHSSLNDVYRLDSDQIKIINEHVNAKMTATWFSETKSSNASREIVTSEIIYHWMISMQIPFECQHWHLGRLLTLIKVVNQKNQPEKKMGRVEIAERNRTLNESRRQQTNSKG